MKPLRCFVCAVAAATGAVWAGAPLNVVEHGADPTGKADSTRVIQALHARGVPLFYPNGTYRFNGDTLDFSGGVTFESADRVVIRNDLSPQPAVVFDAQGRLIGLRQNPLEQDERQLGAKAKMRGGSLVPPPLSTAALPVAVDVVAHWYNDGGLECRRTGHGWIGWYYWSWAFHDSGEPYDPGRHPLLGFYRGDDPAVLDWQCYWLAEYGVKAVSLCSGSVDFDQWQRPEREGHWVYQLFHRVPNFQRLQYVMWPKTPWLKATPENQRKVETGWMQMIDTVYLRFPNFYALEQAGKRYPVLFVYEGEAVRGVFDNYRGAAQTAAFLGRVAERFRGAGYGGVALFVRHATSGKLLAREALARQGVLYFTAFYSDDHAKGGAYPERVAGYAPPVGRDVIVNTCTARHSRAPHPSKWVCPGSTPALFGEQMKNAVAHVCTNGMPRIVTCYNVAEWAEGGESLQPNMRDRFGYLEALRDAVVLPPNAARHGNTVRE
jgi:hypothetical protein